MTCTYLLSTSLLSTAEAAVQTEDCITMKPKISMNLDCNDQLKATVAKVLSVYGIIIEMSHVTGVKTVWENMYDQSFFLIY